MLALPAHSAASNQQLSISCWCHTRGKYRCSSCHNTTLRPSFY